MTASNSASARGETSVQGLVQTGDLRRGRDVLRGDRISESADHRADVGAGRDSAEVPGDATETVVAEGVVDHVDAAAHGAGAEQGRGQLRRKEAEHHRRIEWPARGAMCVADRKAAETGDAAVAGETAGRIDEGGTGVDSPHAAPERLREVHRSGALAAGHIQDAGGGADSRTSEQSGGDPR